MLYEIKRKLIDLILLDIQKLQQAVDKQEKIEALLTYIESDLRVPMEGIGRGTPGDTAAVR